MGKHLSGVDRIISMVRAIPEGWVRTYKDIAPGAPRRVGQVLARNDEDLPWHRVVRADGSLPVGQRQMDLLSLEDVPMRGKKVDMDEARLPIPPGAMPD